METEPALQLPSEKARSIMNVFLWVLQGVLAAIYLMSGSTKVSKPKSELEKQLPWVEDFSSGTVKLIGSAELAGGRRPGRSRADRHRGRANAAGRHRARRDHVAGGSHPHPTPRARRSRLDCHADAGRHPRGLEAFRPLRLLNRSDFPPTQPTSHRPNQGEPHACLHPDRPRLHPRDR